MSETLIEETGSVTGGNICSEAVFPLENQSELQSNQVNLFCGTIDRELFRIMMAPSISESQAKFINDVIVATAEIVHSELKDCKLPDVGLSRTGAGMLPSLVRKLQEEEVFDNQVLRGICANSNGKLLEDTTTWLPVSSEMAKGEVRLAVENKSSRNNKILRNPIEDFAAGMIHFIRLLSDENSGIPADEHVNDQLCNMVNSYETLYFPGAFRAHQQELLEHTAHAACVGEAVLNGFLVQSQVK